jgi:hypothetical protein
VIKILLLVLAICSSQVFAQCSESATKLTATYQLTAQNGPTSHQNALVLWRNGATVAHQYPQTNITESWYLLQNKQIKPTRFFDTQQRAIEYQPGEKVHGKSESDWWYRYQLLSNDLIAQLEKTTVSGKGCQRVQHYSQQVGDTKIELQWLVESQLIRYYRWQQGNKQEVWQLQNLSHDAALIDNFFSQRADYQNTDFADIGDDHSDPFLIKMVTLGFIEHGASGFYDDKGNALDGAHHH